MRKSVLLTIGEVTITAIIIVLVAILSKNPVTVKVALEIICVGIVGLNCFDDTLNSRKAKLLGAMLLFIASAGLWSVPNAEIEILLSLR